MRLGPNEGAIDWKQMFPEHGTRALLPLQHKEMSHSSSIMVVLCHCTTMVRMTAYVRIIITTFYKV